MRRVFALLLLAAALGRSSLAAQDPPFPQPRHPTGAVLGGILGAGIGAFGGVLAGYAVGCRGDRCPGDLDFLGPAIVGLNLGEALLLPVGVHLGNRTAGNLGTDVAVSLGMGVATMLLAVPTESGVILAVGGLAQFGLTVWAERAAGSRAGRTAEFRAFRLAGGRSGIGLRVQH
jgi:hypothetical protein